MKYSDFFAIIDATKMSPEQAAKRLGISNMTLRRWQSRPHEQKLAPKYVRAFSPIFKELAAEGVLPRRSLGPLDASAESSRDFRTTLVSLGFPTDILTSGVENQKALISGLASVGSDSSRMAEVDRGAQRLTGFSRMGAEWKKRISTLGAVIKSSKLSVSDKFVAYGSLFYLLSPFDLIPDAIPVIGFLDDFAVLGLAVWYYENRAGARARRRTVKS